MDIYYVYFYLREDFTPYYVGKGVKNRAFRKRNSGIKPPKDKSRIIILHHNLSEVSAFTLERYYIRWFGRKDNGTGILRNRTDGGEGCSGRIITDSEKEIRKYNSDKLAVQLSLEYEIMNSDGIITTIKNLRKYCRDNNIPRRCLTSVLQGNEIHYRYTQIRKKDSNIKFYTIQELNEIEFKKTQKYKIISPSNNIFYISNLNEFCKNNQLHQAAMWRVSKNIQNSHKGWKCQFLNLFVHCIPPQY